MQKPVCHFSRAGLQFTGLISERRDQGPTHLLMFLFAVGPKSRTLPPVHAEGRFQSFTRVAFNHLN